MNFIEHCDICKSIVIDKIEYYNMYTKTIVFDRSIKIMFYCPDCIKKYNIKVDDYEKYN